MYWIKTFVFVKNTLKYVIYIELYQFDFLTKIPAERFWRLLSWLASSINIYKLDKVLKIYFRVLGVISNLNKFKVWPIYNIHVFKFSGFYAQAITVLNVSEPQNYVYWSKCRTQNVSTG